jgi:hypothetical protein
MAGREDFLIYVSMVVLIRFFFRAYSDLDLTTGVVGVSASLVWGPLRPGCGCEIVTGNVPISSQRA